MELEEERIQLLDAARIMELEEERAQLLDAAAATSDPSSPRYSPSAGQGASLEDIPVAIVTPEMVLAAEAAVGRPPKRWPDYKKRTSLPGATIDQTHFLTKRTSLPGATVDQTHFLTKRTSLPGATVDQTHFLTKRYS
eukprot:gene22875-30046_t